MYPLLINILSNIAIDFVQFLVFSSIMSNATLYGRDGLFVDVINLVRKNFKNVVWYSMERSPV